jgi:hypothetical protein
MCKFIGAVLTDANLRRVTVVDCARLQADRPVQGCGAPITADPNSAWRSG